MAGRSHLRARQKRNRSSAAKRMRALSHASDGLAYRAHIEGSKGDKALATGKEDAGRNMTAGRMLVHCVLSARSQRPQRIALQAQLRSFPVQRLASALPCRQQHACVECARHALPFFYFLAPNAGYALQCLSALRTCFGLSRTRSLSRFLARYARRLRRSLLRSLPPSLVSSCAAPLHPSRPRSLAPSLP